MTGKVVGTPHNTRCDGPRLRRDRNCRLRRQFVDRQNVVSARINRRGERNERVRH